jgi:hypothetical protein
MDNRYYKFGCPPLMSDCRFITSWVDSDVVNQYIRHVNKIKSSNDFRMFLQKNGEQIINKERAFVIKKNTCNVNGKCATLSCGSDKEKCRGMCKCYKD